MIKLINHHKYAFAMKCFPKEEKYSCFPFLDGSYSACWIVLFIDFLSLNIIISKKNIKLISLNTLDQCKIAFLRFFGTEKKT
jgi:hypothetical protein